MNEVKAPLTEQERAELILLLPLHDAGIGKHKLYWVSDEELLKLAEEYL